MPSRNPVNPARNSVKSITQPARNDLLFEFAGFHRRILEFLPAKTATPRMFEKLECCSLATSGCSRM